MAAYALGCINTGYYLVRWVHGRDVRAQGSRSTGATNTGRILGRVGFGVTLLGDAAKGALAVAIAIAAALPEGAQWVAAIAVVVGHIAPVQLRCRGGKGVAPGLGALAVLDPWLLAIAATVTVPAFAALRTLPIAGLVGVLAMPLGAALAGRPTAAQLGAVVLAALLTCAHRDNLRGFLRTGRSA